MEALRQELAEVYKKKAINDQQLIDTNNKLTVVEKDLKKVTKEYVPVFTQKSEGMTRISGVTTPSSA